MKTIQEMKDEFEQIVSEIAKISGVPADSVTQVATVILQEFGKNYRTAMIREARLDNNGFNRNNNSSSNNRNSSQPATDKQKNALSKFGLDFSEDITKAEASEMLDYAIEHANSNREGRRGSARPFPK